MSFLNRRAPLDPLQCFPLSGREWRDFWASVVAWHLADGVQAQQEAESEARLMAAYLVNDCVDQVLETQGVKARSRRA